jgi:MFS family permease
MQLFRVRSFSAGNAAAFLVTASLVGSVFLVAQYLQITLGFSPLGAGLRFIPWTALLFVVAPLAGSVSERLGARPLVVAGPALQAAGFLWLAYNVSNGNPYADSIPALLVAGCGTSMTLPAVQNSVMNSVPPAHLGKASGTFNSMRQLGGVFGVAVASAVFSAVGSYSGPQKFADGVTPALWVCAGLALAASVAGLLLPTRPAPPAPASAPEALVDATV